MPKIGKKEDIKPEKKVSTANEKKEKTKKVVGIEKGKANQKKQTKVQDGKKSTATKNTTTKKTANKTTKTITNKKTTSVKNKAVQSKKDEKKVKLDKIVKPKRKTKVVTTKENPEKVYLPEYYDLPYRYNDTVVKILYQTPKRIFVYWDISDTDRQKYINAFGEDFFERTYPVLLVHNEELNYTFEVPINDFANSWYLDINDSKSKYVVQLGRKFREIEKEQINYELVQSENINLQNDFIYITDSNKLETPNDHILFEKVPEKIVYINVKTGEKVEKEVKQVLRKISKIYDNPQAETLYRDVYKELYGEEILMEEMDISNPSSGGSSSFIK